MATWLRRIISGPPIADAHRLALFGLRQPSGRGELFNVSTADVDPQSSFDRDKPTIVITHGVNAASWLVRFIYPERIAEAIRRRCPSAFNLAWWDYNRGAWTTPRFLRVRHNAIELGRRLAADLRQRSAGRQIHMIGHSLGGLIVTAAARELGGVEQLTLLDSVFDARGRLFGCIQPTEHARQVENYWAPLPFGFGRPVRTPGVFSRRVTERPSIRVLAPFIAPIRGHVNVMLWYLDTVSDPSLPAGFNRSALICRGG
jgi:pimeloyl-ACP methyl ester carboxylesterase